MYIKIGKIENWEKEEKKLKTNKFIDSVQLTKQ